MKFTTADLQVIALALELAQGRTRELRKHEPGQSFFSWRPGRTAQRMGELQRMIELELQDPSSTDER